jgi:hypothetical protein
MVLGNGLERSGSTALLTGQKSDYRAPSMTGVGENRSGTCCLMILMDIPPQILTELIHSPEKML